MGDREATYWEIDHTADWAIECRAPDIEEFLETAALGMYELSGVETDDEMRLSRRCTIEGADEESLLVGFLSELLYLMQTDHVAFDRVHLDRTGDEASFFMVGAPIESIDKEIKAVTWHDVAVEEGDDGWHGQVTFDV